MDLQELRNLTRSAKAVRAFLPNRTPALSDIHRAIELARWTGSAKNRQPWRFRLVRKPASNGELLAACETRVSAPLESAPLAVALLLEEDGYWFDLGRATQTLKLGLSALGLSSCVVSLFNEDAAKQALAVPPGYRCRFILAVGYEDTRGALETQSRVKSVLAHEERLSLDELILDDRVARSGGSGDA